MPKLDIRRPSGLLSSADDSLTAEQETARDLSGLESGFRQRANDEKARLKDASESEYYCVFVFQSKAQRDEFLNSVGVFRLLDDGYFLDGMKVAEQMNIHLKSDVPRVPKLKIDRKWLSLTKEVNANGEKDIERQGR